MSLESVWPGFVLMLVVMGVAASPVFRFLDAEPDPGARYASIDGLRGFLALGVFTFHLVMTRGFIETGAWEVPASRFYGLLGPVGVSLFFMLTGFLFWGKLLRSRGRLQWKALYIGRLFRIAPMYLGVVLVMLLVVAVRTGFELREPSTAVLGAVLQWLALGLIDTQPDVNGHPAGQVLAGVTWTIAYEWAFYAALIVIAPLARRRAHLLFVLAAAALCIGAKMLWRIDAAGFAVLFLSGMTVASLLHDKLLPRLSDRVGSAVALACLTIAFSTGFGGYSTWTGLLLALFFYLVCSGVSLFGLLRTAPAQRLGKISYSLYLMQGLVLTLLFAAGPIRAFALASPWAYWATGIAGAGLLVVCAALGYALVERPGISLGARLVRFVDRRANAASPIATSHAGFIAPPPPEESASVVS